jgi:outer membrane protein OmpA-like peptidoglycan-associated protein
MPDGLEELLKNASPGSRREFDRLAVERSRQAAEHLWEGVCRLLARESARLVYTGARALVVAVGLAAAMPSSGQAQIWDRLRSHAKERLEQRLDSTAAHIVDTGNQLVDTTLGWASGVVDTAVSRTGGLVDSASHRVGRLAAGLLGGAGSTRVATALSSGRAVLPEIRFVEGSDQLQPSAEPHLALLGRAIAGTPGPVVLQAHVDPTGDAAADQALSERRALAVKRRLVAAGLPPVWLFAVGCGSRPPAGARIEVARAQ